MLKRVDLPEPLGPITPVIEPRLTPVRDKLRRSGRGRIARTAQPSYNGIAAENQGSLRQGMPEVTPVEIRAAVAHSAQEPTEATQEWLNAAHEHRRNLRPSGRGGCQGQSITGKFAIKSSSAGG